MSRFSPDLLERWQFVPTIAAQAAPTVAEFNAGTEISGAIQSVTGFKYTGSKIETPDLITRFNTSIPGRYSAEDSSITFYKGDATADVEKIVEALMPDDTAGYICRVYPVSGAKVTIAAAVKTEVWPVKVMSNSTNAPAPGEAVTYTIDYAIPRAPTKVATIAA